MKPMVSALRSVELGVRDLAQSVAYYTGVWGLADIARDGDVVYLRGTGTEHHVLALHQRAQAGLLNVHFAAASVGDVDALYQKAQSFGVAIIAPPQNLSAVAGGGYGFSFTALDGQTLTISADVACHDHVIDDSSRPNKLTHVVLNSTRIDESARFFVDLLGFRVSDETDHMTFIRCARDHHAVAIAKAAGPGLNHMAYEMRDFDGLMRGAGRLKARGVEMEWGVGRHGPGNNIFSYFIEPNGFATEYTTEVEQIDEASYQPHDKAYWASFPMRPCRWGMATKASTLLRHAMAGQLVAERNASCDGVISQALAQSH
jgi:catechol 2,3-dioxygenase-like lactoylglutathione lyase family enzyme